jgi:yeast amino acid transporter
MAEKELENGSPSLEHKPPEYGEGDAYRSMHTRFFDSFKRDPTQHATPRGSIGGDGRVFDLEGAAAATAASPLARKLKGRHLQMIAIGGSIGECIPKRLAGACLTDPPFTQVLVSLLVRVPLWRREGRHHF